MAGEIGLEPIELADGRARLTLHPDRGAAIGRYDLLRGKAVVPLFLSRLSPVRPPPFDLGLNLLLPWSGRISGGGFHQGDRFHVLAPNLADEPCPIHGNGFQSSWRLVAYSAREARLELKSDGPGPFAYDAEVTYALDRGALAIDLEVTNRADATLPYGLGLHPWFPRTPATTLNAIATHIQLEDERHLPAGRVGIRERPAWDFSRRRRLPREWINNCFENWDGDAQIVWPEQAVRLDIKAAPALGSFILYSPGEQADFFCFEPVSHPVDAHNQEGIAEANGLVRLTKGERFEVSARFSPSLVPPAAEPGPVRR